MTLERIIEQVSAVTLPECPVYTQIRELNLKQCEVVMKGYNSNNCMECVGANNNSCQVYKRWYQAYQIGDNKI